MQRTIDPLEREQAERFLQYIDRQGYTTSSSIPTPTDPSFGRVVRPFLIEALHAWGYETLNGRERVSLPLDRAGNRQLYAVFLSTYSRAARRVGRTDVSDLVQPSQERPHQQPLPFPPLKVDGKVITESLYSQHNILQH